MIYKISTTFCKVDPFLGRLWIVTSALDPLDLTVGIAHLRLSE
jgi:hypothetical protein